MSTSRQTFNTFATGLALTSLAGCVSAPQRQAPQADTARAVPLAGLIISGVHQVATGPVAVHNGWDPDPKATTYLTPSRDGLTPPLMLKTAVVFTRTLSQAEKATYEACQRMLAPGRDSACLNLPSTPVAMAFQMPLNVNGQAGSQVVYANTPACTRPVVLKQIDTRGGTDLFAQTVCTSTTSKYSVKNPYTNYNVVRLP